jgi:hypothetical protein
MLFYILIILDGLAFGLVSTYTAPARISNLLRLRTDIEPSYKAAKYYTPPSVQICSTVVFAGALLLIVYRLTQTLPKALHSNNLLSLYSGAMTLAALLVMGYIGALLSDKFLGVRYVRFQIRHISSYVAKKSQRTHNTSELQALGIIQEVVSKPDQIISTAPDPVFLGRKKN